VATRLSSRTHLKAPEEDLALLDLLRNIRNTIHNEGVHRPPRTSSAIVSYQGTEYRFEDGKPVEFVTWSFVLDRINDLVSLQDRIVRHPLLAGCGEHIPDASAEVLPPTL
jgi:hypothetical protein